jgi:hypothetical protein
MKERVREKKREIERKRGKEKKGEKGDQTFEQPVI